MIGSGLATGVCNGLAGYCGGQRIEEDPMYWPTVAAGWPVGRLAGGIGCFPDNQPVWRVSKSTGA
ncbi:hypothetical protein [Protofrankia symbiont of Coriaria ruscifolia]|uniref:hypothetical protein n=1 Tax=Protofrankia symbiont of Coriaria ruscifolia TaxID=1306542 RepID=UPI001041685A|nr:hypothetical protein [Protofrankia symbiont of Coriaria ruscifolia]